MLPVNITIKIDPSSPGLRQLEQLVSKASDTEGLLHKLGPALQRTTEERFENESDPGGAPWTPLSAKTVERRGRAHPILRVRGRLKGSINYQVDGDTLRLGPNVVYAAVHQFGFPKKNIPARPYIGFGKEDEDAARDTLTDWFTLDK